MRHGYQRLQACEREEISRGLGQGMSLRDIGRALGRTASTISREIRQGHANRWTYRAIRAHHRAMRQAGTRRWGKTKLAQNIRLQEVVFKYLRLRWSPEQIAHRLRVAYSGDSTMQISHETIYTSLYILPRGQLRKEMLAYLRRGHRRRHRRRALLEAPRKPLADMVSIAERPPEVDDRKVVGHWEGDLLIGRNRQSAMGTLVERKTRYLLLVRLRNRTADEVCTAFCRALRRIPRAARRTLTYDQGREMANHRRLTKKTKVPVYFAHPASPWERGTNENTNGLVRQFFPKGTDFSRVTLKDARRVEWLLNGRPRKVLQWETPKESMQETVALKV